MSGTYALYRFYSECDELLYIGITCNPPARFRDHQVQKDWWHQIATIRLEHYENRDDLDAAERHAIKTERPRYNIFCGEPRQIAAVHAAKGAVLYSLAEATELICGPNSGLRDPQGWVVRKLRAGEFSGMKIGRNWFMSDAHIETAIAKCENGIPDSVGTSVEPAPIAPAVPDVSILDGLSARSRRRLISLPAPPTVR